MPNGERRHGLEAFLDAFAVFKGTWEKQDDLIAHVFKPSTGSEVAIRAIKEQIISLKRRGQ